jgi:hypothetical protein
MAFTKSNTVAVTFRWLGRTLALLLLLFWGTFFLEHLSEWFRNPVGAPPPTWVWISQMLHLGMLVGLALSLRWDRLGAIVTALGTTAFFASIGMHSFPFIALLNLLPIACFTASWSLHPPRDRPARPIPECSSG